MTKLLFNRTAAGVSDLQVSNTATHLDILYPRQKQNATDNPTSGGVLLYWTAEDMAPTQANGIVKADIGWGRLATITLGDYGSGYFWVKAVGGAAIELHVTERRP
jgi:hypothetical protein